MSRPTIRQSSGTRTLTALRVQARLSQTDLSRLTRIPQPVISMYEHGLEIPGPEAEKLFQALSSQLDLSGVSPQDLSAVWNVLPATSSKE